jgi:Ferredoxin-like domain in Api92-like protein
MPNWTSNTLRIEGSEPDLRAFLDAVKWQDQIFDFNRIIPMPELLKHTGSGYQTLDGKEVHEWYVIGNEADLLFNDKSVRLFTPEEEATLKALGHRSWYTWSNEHWGTKWNACNAELRAEAITDGFVEITFDTAWDAPGPIFRKLFARFPKLKIICTWQHEDGEGPYSLTHNPVINATDQSPIAKAKALTPPWMTKIREFDGLEVQPCTVVGQDALNHDIVEPCAAEDATFWTVYGHYRPTEGRGGVEALEDFPTETEARQFHDRLISAYPHLASSRGGRS